MIKDLENGFMILSMEKTIFFSMKKTRKGNILQVKNMLGVYGKKRSTGNIKRKKHEEITTNIFYINPYSKLFKKNHLL